MTIFAGLVDHKTGEKRLLKADATPVLEEIDEVELPCRLDWGPYAYNVDCVALAAFLLKSVAGTTYDDVLSVATHLKSIPDGRMWILTEEMLMKWLAPDFWTRYSHYNAAT